MGANKFDLSDAKALNFLPLNGNPNDNIGKY